MSKKKETVTITISIDADLKKCLEQYALEVDNTLSKLCRNLIYASLDDFKILETVKLGKQMFSPIQKEHFKRSMTAYAETKEDNFSGDDLGESVQLSVIIDKEVKNVLEEYSGKLNLPLKTFTVNLIYIGLHDVNLLRKLGLVKLATAFTRFMETYLAYKPKYKQ